jgi:transposase
MRLDAVIGPGSAATFCERRLSLTVMVERGPVIGPKHQHGGTAMEHYAAIDVSLEWSSVCVVDAAGQIVREAKARSEREALVAFFEQSGLSFARIGLEAGPLSQWLHAGLAEAGLPAVLIETRHVKAALQAMTVKTDKNDARGMAQLMRMGWFRPVHVKAPAVQEMRALLTARKLLIAKLRDVESSLRGILRGFGLKVGAISKGKFEARVRELVSGQAMLERIAEPLLRARAALRAECATLHGDLLKAVRADEVCRRLMTIPGVGAVVAMTFRSAVDQPERFARSKAVGAHFGLTPRKYQSGEIDRTGRISKVGDAMVRTALFEAANVMLTRSVRLSALKAWALRVAGRQGMKKAKVALARKLAVVMHRMWLDGTEFRWGRQTTLVAAA